MPAPLALIIPAIASIISSKMAGDAQQASSAAAASGGAAGQGFGDIGGAFNETGTDKYNETIRSLNEGGEYNRDRLFAAGHAPESGSLSDSLLSPGDNTHMADIAAGGAPSGNVMGGAEGGGGEGDGGGFNMDNALQYAALAAQLGSMFAPPPPPPAPRGGANMNVNAQPFTMRMMGGR